MPSGGTLDGVTYQGTLDLNGSTLFTKDGFTGGAGGALITGTGTVDAIATETIDNAILNLATNGNALAAFDSPGAPVVLTLGPSMVVNHVGGASPVINAHGMG